MRVSLLLACLAVSAIAHADDFTPLIHESLADDKALAAAICQYYTKYDYRIPMRDGVRLYAVAYVPKGDGPWPVLLQRTPYGAEPYGEDNYPGVDDGETRFPAPSREAIANGYIFVVEDVRGRLMSEGRFADVRPVLPSHAEGRRAAGGSADQSERGSGGKVRRTPETDEATDTWDTIEFLVHHLPRNNGRVGMWGRSYPGLYAALGAIDAHPALKAVSPQAPVTDWFTGDDFHHNGAFFLADAFSFYAFFGIAHPKPTEKMGERFHYDAGDLYEFFLKLGALSHADADYFHGAVAFWKDLMTHGTLDDFWRARNPLVHYRNLHPAMLTVGGLFDAEDLFGTVATYHAIEKQSPGIENAIVLGPWSHGGWFHSDGETHGDLDFGMKTSVYYRREIELPFFERHLRGRSLPRAAEATVFETGTDEWRRYDAWPPKEAKRETLYLAPGGKLATQAPPSSSADRYVSDPAHPVPYTAGYALRRNVEYMSEDQRFASRRTDVLSYVSPTLSADVAIAGPVEADLWVSTTGTDADFVVKLVDVYPPDAGSTHAPSGKSMAGYEQLVRAEIMRGKFRDDLSTPKPFVPNTPTRVHVTLPDVSHAFRMGHRIAVQIQSSWFPLVDRNPQKFCDIYRASDSDFHAETEVVLVGGEHASSVHLRVMRGSLP